MLLLLLFAIARYALHYMANRTSSLRDHGKKYREIQVHSGGSRPSDRWGGEGGGGAGGLEQNFLRPFEPQFGLK